MSDTPFGAGRLVAYLKEKNKLWIILAALVLGISLIFLSGTDGEASSYLSEYEDISGELERRVEKICGDIQGVSEVSVMITLDSVRETKYAQNSQINKDETNVSERYEYVTMSQSLIPIAEISPKVRGVAVVCRGGGRAEIQLKLTELLCALFDIPASAVSVMEGK